MGNNEQCGSGHAPLPSAADNYSNVVYPRVADLGQPSLLIFPASSGHPVKRVTYATEVDDGNQEQSGSGNA